RNTWLRCLFEQQAPAERRYLVAEGGATRNPRRDAPKRSGTMAQTTQKAKGDGHNRWPHRLRCVAKTGKKERQSSFLCSGRSLRLVLARSSSSSSDMESYISFAAPFRLDALDSPRLADSAAPAAFCCALDWAGMIVSSVIRILTGSCHPETEWADEGCVARRNDPAICRYKGGRRSGARLGCHRNHHVAYLLPGFDVLVRLHDVVQRIAPVDDGPEVAVFDQSFEEDD